MPQDPTEPIALAELRRRIDALDERLHDLLIERAAAVEEVGRVKQAGAVATLRPGREAQILRRLLARHRGKFPRAGLVRLWRELFAGTVAMQAPVSVAVEAGVRGEECRTLARGHFGIDAALRPCAGAAAVLATVAAGDATVGVLPVDAAQAWWRPPLPRGAGGPLRVVARLPFAIAAPGAGALAVACFEADPSGEDCRLFAVAAAGGTAALLQECSDRGGALLAKSDALALVELADAARQPGGWTELGRYARPVDVGARP